MQDKLKFASKLAELKQKSVEGRLFLVEVELQHTYQKVLVSEEDGEEDRFLANWSLNVGWEKTKVWCLFQGSADAGCTLPEEVTEECRLLPPSLEQLELKDASICHAFFREAERLIAGYFLKGRVFSKPSLQGCVRFVFCDGNFTKDLDLVADIQETCKERIQEDG